MWGDDAKSATIATSTLLLPSSPLRPSSLPVQINKHIEEESMVRERTQCGQIESLQERESERFLQGRREVEHELDWDPELMKTLGSSGRKAELDPSRNRMSERLPLFTVIHTTPP